MEEGEVAYFPMVGILVEHHPLLPQEEE